ncbi:hypothetical protein SHKM778_58590 [Streptomyces sp. KM77-8]|uniref:Integral membrane protein n=1 Tax=Streptomyces haneummycinicus TaxID=3074435 RepID=A0AAT9HPR7_9ACTN
MLAAVAAAPVAYRRRFPVPALVVANAATTVWFLLDYHGRLITLAPLVCCYALGAGRGWRAGAAGGLLTAGCTVLAVRFALDGGWLGDQVFNAVPLVAAVTALGAAVHSTGRSPPERGRAQSAWRRRVPTRLAGRRPRNGWRSRVNSTTCSATPWRRSACRRVSPSM